MSVHTGRFKRQLYTPDQALTLFKKTEGVAMPPVVSVSLGRAMLGLVLLTLTSTLSTYGIYNGDKDIMFIGLFLLCGVALWMFAHISK